jgi:hypothetical protein
MQCCSTFQVKQAEILASEGFGENLQQILIQKYFFNGYPQLVHRLQQRTKSDESIPPFIPPCLLDRRGEFDHELPVSFQGTGEILDDESGAFFLLLFQQAVKSVPVEQFCVEYGRYLLFQLPGQPVFKYIPTDFNCNIIDDLSHAFPGWILPF